MTIEGEGGSGAGEITGGEGGAGGDAGAGGGAGGGSGGDGGAAPREWMNGLPDDLKGDATLSRYEDVPALAKAHIEAHKVARSRVLIPGEGANDDDWGKVWNALGRPENLDDYEIPTGVELSVDATDEQRNALAEAVKPFKETAHKLGLTAAQAKGVAEFDLARQNAYYEKGAAEIEALKTQMGRDYEPKRQAATRAFAQVFGVEGDAAQLAEMLENKVGSAALVKGMMRLAERMGEHSLIESDSVSGIGEVKNAEAKIDELMADKAWRDRYNADDPATKRQYQDLLAIAQRQASRPAART